MYHSCFLEGTQIHIADLTSTSAFPQPSVKVLYCAKKTKAKKKKKKKKRKKKEKNKKKAKENKKHTENKQQKRIKPQNSDYYFSVSFM
uniref:Uncharacterized protein n=1 Tax=Prolemur simus TaxID=1328070 RepID=A0A8C8YIF0_PROSS